MISVQQLTFGYRKASALFSDLYLQLTPGNIYGLLGKNGAGKTTLLKIISGLLYSHKGQVTVYDTDTKLRLPSMLRDLYFIPEDLISPAMKGSTFISIYKPFYPKFDPMLMNDLLTEFDISEQEALHKMSFGQRKKFFIAFGLATNTRLLILDEPTNGLDIPSKSLFRKMIASQMTENRIVIVSTHQVRDLQSLIDPVIVLDNGKIVFNRTIEEIQDKLVFETYNALDNSMEFLYTETSAFGVQTIRLRSEQRPSRVDIELLFNAIVADNKHINQLF